MLARISEDQMVEMIVYAGQRETIYVPLRHLNQFLEFVRDYEGRNARELLSAFYSHIEEPFLPR
ncbi:MAG: hypothetical protein VW270_27940 [Candidatus Poseidoniales archaeon]